MSTEPQRPTTIAWSIFAAAAASFVLIVLFAPAEQTLGRGMRAVYVHVPLVWVGMACLATASILGALLLAWDRSPKRIAADAWSRALVGVGTIAYAAGLATSLVASKINWGSVIWTEPRLAMSFRVVALALAVHFVAPRLEWPRARGAARLALGVFMAWALAATPLYAHPRNPIGTSSAWMIRGAFYSLFALLAGMAAWVAAQWQQRVREK